MAWVMLVTTTIYGATGHALHILSKFWRSIAVHTWYPFSVSIGLEDFGGMVQLLSETSIGYPISVYIDLEDLGRMVHHLSENTQRILLCFNPNPEHSEWLKSVDGLQKKEKRLKKRYSKGGLSYLTIWYISKEVKNELKEGSHLLRQGDMLVEKLHQHLPGPAFDIQPEKLKGNFPGMEVSYDRVLDFIGDNDDKSALMGVWGIGGMGKTTLMKWVFLDARSMFDDYFSVMMFVDAEKGFTTVADLQKAISISIELPRMGNEIFQSETIHNYLQDKDFLLLMDDLWEYVNLEKIGIPSLHSDQTYRRKVVFTTRSMDVCRRMGCRLQYIIQMKCLNKEDSFVLLAEKVGELTFGMPEIGEFANEIIDECKGLPIVLCTIGKFMSSKTDPMEWRTIIDLLKKSKLHEITDLFNRQQESYDNPGMETSNAKVLDFIKDNDAKGINELDEKEENKIMDEYGPSTAELIKSNDLINQVDRLLSEIKARLYNVQHELSRLYNVQHELSSTFPGMEGSYDKVLHFIQDKSPRAVLMGIWGMRGVGKTTLLRLVRDTYTDDESLKGSFDHILFVGTGTGRVLKNVQHAISTSLRLDYNEDSLECSGRIRSYLQDKSFLLLLDDVKEPLDLGAVGLPALSHKQQKIIMVTTSRAIISPLMGCEAVNTMEMRCLGKDDAWKLFKSKVGRGIIDDDPEVHHIAQQMVSRCKGLPLSLCALGRAMSGKRNPMEWRSAYSQLKDIDSQPSEIEEKGTLIHSPLYRHGRRYEGTPDIPSDEETESSV